MGSYSFFNTEEIDVKDWEGLKNFLEIYQKKYGSYFGFDLRSMIKIGEDKKEYFSFEDWTDIKLISYWYDYECIFMLMVAKFIEGNVIWEFENSDEAGFIDFENGEAKITTGVMEYHHWKPTANITDKNIEDMPDEFKKMLIMGELKCTKL